MPLQSIPIMLRNPKNAEMVPAPNFNTIPSKITGTQKKFTDYNEFMRKNHNSQTVWDFNRTHRFSRESRYGSAYNSRTMGTQFTRDVYEDIALSDTFLNAYYTQVTCQLYIYKLVPSKRFQMYWRQCAISFLQTEGSMCSAREGWSVGVLFWGRWLHRWLVRLLQPIRVWRWPKLP